MGHRPRGLQRRRRRLGLLPARPRPQQGLPLGRGRPGRHLRPLPDPVLRPRPLERARPDPEGAPLRPRAVRGQPRRGREGVLLLPRLHADALVHEVALQVPAARVPVRAAHRGEPPRGGRAAPSSSCSTPASSTTTATSTSSSSTRRPRPRTWSSASPPANRGPEPAPLHLLPHLWFRNTWAWGVAARARRRPSRPGPSGAGFVSLVADDRPPSRCATCRSPTGWARATCTRRRRRAPLHRQRDERAARARPGRTAAARPG